ncbi:EamA family transporter [Rathayibacter sp. AY2B7]|uniref:DMT family transporter n=1 Tax=Rathayibacter sp. AY2B7 TaxID=2080571 RepID=UPI000CE79730|nr:DMT family transporter [Rathayibacter sp. AY2B7]PPG49845.1 EamA family transporter [Rathayibacter sp. AY2B7]
MSGRIIVLLYVFLAIAQGIPYLLVKIAVADIDPTVLVLVRAGGAALLLLPIAAWRRELQPALRHWRAILAYATAEFALPWLLTGVAELSLPSSMTGLLITAVPLLGVGIGLFLGTGERLSRLNVGGLVLGVCGVALLVGISLPPALLSAAMLVLLVGVGYAVGAAILAVFLRKVPATAVTALSFGAVALAYLPVVVFTAAWPTSLPSWSTIVSLAILVVVCSAGAFLALAVLVRRIGPVRTATVTYLNPLVAVAVGVAVLGETLRATTLIGLGVILAACILSTTSASRSNQGITQGRSHVARRIHQQPRN